MLITVELYNKDEVFTVGDNVIVYGKFNQNALRHYLFSLRKELLNKIDVPEYPNYIDFTVSVENYKTKKYLSKPVDNSAKDIIKDVTLYLKGEKKTYINGIASAIIRVTTNNSWLNISWFMGYRAKGGVYFIFKQIVGRTQINDKKTIDILTHFSRKYNYPELIKKIKEYGRNNV